MVVYDVYYFDKDTRELVHIEKGYKCATEAMSDAETYSEYDIEIEERIK